MTHGLNCARVLVTRPGPQAENLCRLLAENNGLALCFPTLEIAGVQPEPDLLATAASSDWLIFTSTNAVDFAIKAFGGKMPKFNVGMRIASVGQATANALLQAGWRVDCVPASDFSSEGLLAEPPMHAVVGARCTIVRGVGGREKLAEALVSRGAEVSYLEVYSRSKPDADGTELAEILRSKQLQATTVTSVEALQNLLHMLDEEAVTLLRRLPLVVVSDRIKKTAEQLGFKQIAVSRQPTDAAILETLTTLLNGENSGRSN